MVQSIIPTPTHSTKRMSIGTKESRIYGVRRMAVSVNIM